MMPNFATSFLSQVFVIGTLCEINISISSTPVGVTILFLDRKHYLFQRELFETTVK